MRKKISNNCFFIKAVKSSFLKDSARWAVTLIQASISAIFILFSQKKKRCKYVVSVCGLFKDEGEFLKEWIDYHLIIGVDHFYLYNNNSTDDYLNVLTPYIQKGIVDLVDWPHKFPQMAVYKDCLERHREDTEWIAYIDIDEFVCPIYEDNIKKWLKPYEKYPSVLIYWKVFGTSGALEHDNDKLVIEQYTNAYDRLMNMGKYFLNTSYHFPVFNSPHLIYAYIKLGLFTFRIPPVNEYRKFVCAGLHRISFCTEKVSIQLNHYWSKSYATFLKNKIRRSDVFSDENEKYNKESLLIPNERKCIVKDFSIQKYLIDLKLKK